MGLTVLPSSLPSRRGAVAAPRACASRLRLDPACISNSAATNAKRPKRPGSCHNEEPSTKRRHVGQDDGATAAKSMSLEEKHGVNRLLLSLLPPGRSPNEVIPLPDSIVRVLQENGTWCRGGKDDEIEIDVYALGDDAIREIKERVGVYLADRAGREEAPEHSKEGVVEQSKPRSIPSKAAPKSIAFKAAPTSMPPRAPPKRIPPRAVPSSTPSRPALVSIQPRPEAVPSSLALLKPSESRGSLSEHLETAISQSPPRSDPPTASPSLASPPNPSGGKKSMKELLADAGKVMRNVVRRRELEQLRAAARQEVEKMVRTVEFNDPYIDYRDVFK